MRKPFHFISFTSFLILVIFATQIVAQTPDAAGPPEPQFPVLEEGPASTPNLDGIDEKIQLEPSDAGTPETPESIESNPAVSMKTEQNPGQPGMTETGTVTLPASSTLDASSPKPILNPAAETGEISASPANIQGTENTLPESQKKEIQAESIPQNLQEEIITPQSVSPQTNAELPKQNNPNSEKILPQSVTPTLATAEKEEKPMKKTEEISVSRRVLENLCPAGEAFPEGIEAVDLRTFLNAPRLNSGTGNLREALHIYWEATELRSAVFYWENRLKAMQEYVKNATDSDLVCYESALASTEADLSLAKINLRTNAMNLAAAAGYVREVTAQTPPHAGEYDTRFEQLRSTSGESTNVARYNGLILLRQAELTAAAAAYSTSEAFLKLVVQNSSKAEVVIQAWDVLNNQRKAFFKVLVEFNEDILNYVLTVSQRRGPDLAHLLIRSVTEVSLKGYNPGSQIPSLPTAPLPASQVPGEKELPSVMENGLPVTPATTPVSGVPQSTSQGNTIGNESVQMYPENAAINLPQPVVSGEIPVSQVTSPPSGTVMTEEVTPVVVPEASPVVVPGGNLGVPNVETPPAGSDFVPLGGETGVDTSPVLNSPSAKNDTQNLRSRTHGQKISILTAHPTMEEVEVPQTISLQEVLEQVSIESRERAVHTYWRYVMFQKQIAVLEYQQQILDAISKRVLAEDSQSKFVPEFGISLELQYLNLRMELLSRKTDAWSELIDLNGLISRKTPSVDSFPIAVTDMKSEGFQVGLDRNAPGSLQDRRTLPLARHLYFCVGELSQTFQNVAKYSDQIAPPEGNIKESEFFQKLNSSTPETLEALFTSLRLSRLLSFRYFQVLYAVNSVYSSCILADSQHGSTVSSISANMLAGSLVN